MLGAAVLGSGTQALRMAQAVRKVDGLSLVGLWSRSSDRARQAASQAGTQPFETLEKLWALPDLKLVLVAGESDRHAELGLEAARAGRHVLVEKPIDISPERAEALVRECRERGVGLGVISQKRFSPRFRRVKEALDSGALGRPLAATVLARAHRNDGYFSEGNGWRGDAARGGGVLLNQGMHWLDLLSWWLGDFESARGCEGARREGLKAPETVGGTVRFRSGAVATLLLSTGAKRGPPDFVELVAEKGAVQFEGGRVRVWDLPGEGTRGLLGPLTRKLPLPLRTALTLDALESPRDGTVEDQIRQFAGAIASGRDPESPGEEGVKALRLALALADP